MELKRLHNVTFSPAFHTEAMQAQLCQYFPYEAVSMNLTPFFNRKQALSLAADEVLLLGAPVYGGRIPEPAVQRFKNLRGQGTAAILLVTFGNRAFEDALLEMQDILTAQGFVVLAGAALVTEHSIASGYGEERPDDEDSGEMRRFAEQCVEKIRSLSEAKKGEVQLAGHRPYRERGGKHNIPTADENCIRCGVCAQECPVAAIDSAHVEKADPALCFSCMRCVAVCPHNARGIPVENVTRIRDYLESIDPPRKDNYFCL